MAEEDTIEIDPMALPTADALAGTYGEMPAGTTGGEGNYFQVALALDPESGDQTMTFSHKTCFVPSGKDLPFSGMWLDESHVFTGTWAVTSEEKTAEGKEEGKEEAPVQIAIDEINAAFAEADVDSSGAVGFEEIQAMEEKFGLPMAISANAEDWADGKISLEEFTQMLKTNGNIAPPPKPPNAVFTLQSATKKMQVVEDGTFTEAEQPYSKYTWTFRMNGPDYTSLELVDSNYPVSLSRARFVRGETIEMKYCELKLQKNIL
jgi:hypothetical protein